MLRLYHNGLNYLLQQGTTTNQAKSSTHSNLKSPSNLIKKRIVVENQGEFLAYENGAVRVLFENNIVVEVADGMRVMEFLQIISSCRKKSNDFDRLKLDKIIAECDIVAHITDLFGDKCIVRIANPIGYER